MAPGLSLGQTRVVPGTNSGKKKEPKPKLFGPDIFQWGKGLPRERVGAKKFDKYPETREIKLFGRDIPGFCRDIPGVPEKFEKKRLVFNFRSLQTQVFWLFYTVEAQFVPVTNPVCSRDTPGDGGSFLTYSWSFFAYC